MPYSSTFRASVPAAAIFLLLAGCTADPASEEPITLAPGNYHVTSIGGFEGVPSAGRDPSGPLDEHICIEPGDVENFPEAFTREHTAATPATGDCQLDNWKREGNAFDGVSACPLGDRSMSNGSLNHEFEGVISTDRVELHSQLKIRFSEAGLARADPALAQELRRAAAVTNRIEMRFSAVRTGDCK